MLSPPPRASPGVPHTITATPPSPVGTHTGCGDTSHQPQAVTPSTAVPHHHSLTHPRPPPCPLLQQIPGDTRSPPVTPSLGAEDGTVLPFGLTRGGGTVGTAPSPSHRTLSHHHKATGSLKPPRPHIPSRQGATLHPALPHTGVGGGGGRALKLRNNEYWGVEGEREAHRATALGHPAWGQPAAICHSPGAAAAAG